MKRACRITRWLGAVGLACGALASAPLAAAADRVPLAVADFDYADTSGEVRDQSAEHAARLTDFARLVRDELSASGRYEVVALKCPKPRCSADSMDAKSLTEAARQSGARLLLYGGVRKMSTLVQFGKAQIVDLESDKVVFDRTITFRGDNAEAWRRAGEFLAEDLLASDLSAED